ncbi:MAG: carbon-nitrogen hydrolase family protein [Candidatus Omnitrophica bacterium]|nr:carbon-nitrogen hydrolase family protein [Candidatus Omnitrophota bacterium]
MMERRLRIVSASMAYGLRQVSSRQENYQYVRKVLQEAQPISPDIAVFPEIFPLAGIVGQKASQKVSRYDLDFLTAMAKEFRVWLIGSIYRYHNQRLFNSAVVIDRKGAIVGYYDKVHPTETELKQGVLPGSKMQKPILTPWGKIGVQICFDANWPNDWCRLVTLGAEIIFFPSAFPGGKILTSLATLNHVFIVPSVWSLHSGIISNTGEWLVQTDRFQWWVWKEINLDRTVYHWDYQGYLLERLRRCYGSHLLIETYGPEAWFVLTPTVPELTISEVEKKFKLVRYPDYLKRATRAQEKARN